MEQSFHQRRTLAKLIGFVATFIAFYAGCGGSFLLQTKLGFSPILAASVLGFAITFVPLTSHIDKKSFLFIFCTGTFAAMSSREIIVTPAHLLIISLIGAIVYVVAKSYFAGIGGKMGFLAFVTIAIWLLMRAST